MYLINVSMRCAICAMTAILFICTHVLGQTNKNSSDLKMLDWLNGTWDRTNSKPGHSGHERWSARGAREMSGYGVTMKGVDTLFIEKLKIIHADSGTYYVADVAENKQPVSFKLTSSTSTTYIFENVKHDFPKRIEYKRENDKMHVIVSGDGKSIDFFFSKR
jgi:hypothetical protein